MKTKCFILLLFLIGILFCSMSFAESNQGSDTLTQANNPLANMKAFNIHNYMIGELTESNVSANQLWMRYAQPFSLANTNWLMRASLPINTFPTGPAKDETGLGDFNIFAAYLFDMPDPALSIGLGPQLTLPTATDDALGTEKWSAGLAHVIFDARDKQFQWGYLLTWQHSFMGDSDRADVNLGALQPFLLYQLGGGTYLRSAPVWVYDFENNDYTVPLGVGIGQVVKNGNTVFNFFIEPQVSVIDDGAGWADWQIFFGLNMQFLGP